MVEAKKKSNCYRKSSKHEFQIPPVVIIENYLTNCCTHQTNKNNMLYSVVKHKINLAIPLNHIAANPRSYVKIPHVVEDIEKTDLQESDHTYKKSC